MTRSVKLLTPAASLLVLFAVAEFHALFVGHYPLTQEPRFFWLVVLLLLVWAGTYVAGVNEVGIPLRSRLVRAAIGVGSAVVVIALVDLIVQNPHKAGAHPSTIQRYGLLPRFDLGWAVLLLVPVLAAVSAWADRVFLQQGQQERVLALVSDEDRERLVGDLKHGPERPSQLVLAIDPVTVLPTADNPQPLIDLIAAHKSTLLVLSRDAQSLDEVITQAVQAHSDGVRIRTLSLFYDEWLGKLPISELERIALLFDNSELHRPAYARVKRSMDVAIAAVGTVFLGLAIPAVWFLDLFGNRGPLFYQQPRVGRNGEIFTIHKFRTMRPSKGPTSWTEANDPRLTRVGNLLRRLHVDELPQVWNVLRREMSVVGPRPEQPHYVEQLRVSIPFYDVRHLVRPGITGWAQVKWDYGSTELDALEKLQYEFFYLRHQDFGLDLRIMGRTIRSMFHGEGR